MRELARKTVFLVSISLHFGLAGRRSMDESLYSLVFLDGNGLNSFWARLARVRIGAEMLEADVFWRGEAAPRQSVLQAFAEAGVRAVVAEYTPDNVKLSGIGLGLAITTFMALRSRSSLLRSDE